MLHSRPPPTVLPVPERFTIERDSRGEIRVVEEKPAEGGEGGAVWKKGKEEFVSLPYEMIPEAPDFEGLGLVGSGGFWRGGEDELARQRVGSR